MVNHPNRGKVMRIRGAVMTAGYRDGDGGVTRVRIRADGRVVEHDPDMHALAQDEADNSPLVLDEDGLLTRTGAAAGWGFLPDAGEVERIIQRGGIIPASQAA